ncbi:MAG TPA: DUF3501 family protein [Candidatus Dormibacteraeota bacterium]|jgi:hypothetical protein|nr:DUF3501 family protein [Candidatus Dormibacteraeota bacterium]
MQKLTPEDVLPLDDYLRVRDQVRASVRAERARRRVAVGDRVSLHFENRDTVLLQIGEMMRVENIRDTEKVAEEVRVYNDLIAADDELRATFFVEITDRGRIKQDLDSLVGLETEGLSLLVGDERIPAEFEPGHAREDRISAVHYVRFVLTPAQRRAIAAGEVPVSLEIDHPGYRARAELSRDTRAALAEDMGEAVQAG